MQPSEGQGGHQLAGWRARDGRFYFPSVRGVAMVDPRLGKASPPFVHIERLVLDGTAQELGQSLEVLPGQGYLENHYTGLSLGKPEQVRFSYQMSGQQQTWQDVGTRRTIYFPQLPPGTYRFSVRALSPDGVWGEQAAAVNIVVKPHFWQTSWYQLLVLGGLAGGLALAYRQREACINAAPRARKHLHGSLSIPRNASASALPANYTTVWARAWPSSNSVRCRA